MSTLITGQSPEMRNWNEQKNRLKTKFPSLTDTDLQYEEGKRDLMFTRLQIKLGRTRAELDSIIFSQIIY